MKKIILTAIAVGMMTTSGFAGTVSKIVTKSDGTVRIAIIKGTDTFIKPIVGTPDANKAMLAVALTALTSRAEVESTQDAGAWTSISILQTP